jgi:hypothetical protein
MICITKQEYVVERAGINDNGHAHAGAKTTPADTRIAEAEFDSLDLNGDHVLTDQDADPGATSDAALASHFGQLRPDGWNRALAALAPMAERLQQQGKNDLGKGLLAFKQGVERRRDAWATAQLT